MSEPLHDPSRGRPGAPPSGALGSQYAPPYAPSYATAAREAAGDRLNLRRVLAALRPHAALVAVFTLLTVGVTAFLISREVPTYRARALVQVVDPRNVLPKELGGTVTEQATGDQRSDPVLSQLVVLQGRGVLGEAVDRDGLRLVSRQAGFPRSRLTDVQVTLPAEVRDVVRLSFGPTGVLAERGAESARATYGAPVVLGGLRFVVPSRPAVSTAALAVLPREDAIDSVGHALRASPREGTNGVDVEFTSSDSVAAVRVTNGVVDAFQRVDARTAQQDARRRHIFLAEQLVDVEKLLATAQGQLTSFRQRAQVYDSRDQLVAEQANLLQLDTQREQLEADRRTYQTLLDALTRAPRGGGDLQALVSAGAATTNPVIAQLYAQVVQYETARDSLTSGEWGRASTNPDVQRQAALAEAARARLIAATRSQLAALGARVGSVDVQRGRRAAVLQTLPSAEAEEQRLGQQVGTLTNTAEQLRSEYQKARIAEAVETGQVNVVSGATRAELVSTHRGARLAFGLALGLLLGVAAAFLIDHFNTSIRNRDELETVLQIPGLAVIPPVEGGVATRGNARGLDVRRLPSMARFGRGGGRGGTRGRRPTPIAALAAGTSFDGEDGAAPDAGATGLHHASAAAEAYRALRTNLLYAQTSGPLKTLVVTSPAAADGKTTTAVNLSVAFAQQGLRVLLIDCDLRRPALAAALGVQADPGVTDLLLGRAELPAGIYATRVPRLDLLPCGTARGDAAELLGSPQMRGLVDRVAAEYDLVVMDTPPVLAASDAVVLAARADGVLLVLRAGETDRGAAQFALQQLTGVRARVVGGVLNDPDAKLARYGGYAAYGYAYAG
ncbi:MAG TPA: polysaccharide biosynthesis tyrosine autokinase [Gemmatirosa sp.]